MYNVLIFFKWSATRTKWFYIAHAENINFSYCAESLKHVNTSTFYSQMTKNALLKRILPS